MEDDELEVSQESAEDLKHAFTSMYDAMLQMVWEKIGMPLWLLNMFDKSEEDAREGLACLRALDL